MGKKEDKTLKKARRMRKQDEELLNEILDERTDLTNWEEYKRKRTIRRTKKLFRAIDILFALAQNACPYVNKTNEDSIITETDIVYDESNSDVCKLDFYHANTGEKQPAIILIHGGGFTAGD
ncbi:MAG: hypothetical protein K2L88_01065, partial [Clostridiales bacterium]|nr:hypothetical protein [Clostridiales bacterium]